MDKLLRITTVAIDLFRRYGLKSPTMDDIARRSGMSKKTLYHYFANKEEVVAHAVQFSQEGLKKRCLAILAANENAVIKLCLVLDVFDEVAARWNKKIFFEFERYYAHIFEYFKTSLQEVNVHVLEEVLNEGIATGLIRQIDAGLYARYKMDLLLLLLNSLTDVSPDTDTRKAFDDLFVCGILSEKGKAIYEDYKKSKEHSC